MKILIISHFLPYPPHGGNFQRNYNLLREASKRHEVYFYSFNQKKLCSTKALLDESVAALKPFCKEIRIFDVPCDRTRWGFPLLLLKNIFSSKPYLVPRFTSTEMTQAILELLSKQSIEVVHFETIAVCPYLSLFKDIPKALVHQNVESDLLMQRARKESNFLKSLYIKHQAEKLRNYEDQVVEEIDLNIAVSEEDKDRFLQRGYKSTFAVVPNGTDLNYFKPTNTETVDDNSIVFAGTLDWYPNHDGMIYFLSEIFPNIKKKYPEAKFHLIGKAPSEKIVSLAKEIEGVTVHGFVDDARTLIRSSAVYVVPLRIGGGSRLKILDALASGKAVVSTSIGAEGLKLTNGSDIAIADQAEHFASEVARLLEDQKAREELETNGRKTVEKHYSWSVIGEEANKLWQNLKS